MSVIGSPSQLITWVVSSVYTRDYPTVQAVTLVFAVFVVLVNLGTDVLVAMLDPRARATMAR